MTDHSPQTVDRIAQGIREANRNAMATRMADVDVWYHTLATAALDAMPQPIGYGILVHRFAPEAAYIKGPMPLTDAVDMVTTEPDPERGETTVVALIPVEDQ